MTSYIRICLATLVVWTNRDLTVADKVIDEAFRRYMIVPQITPVAPPQLLYVDYFGTRVNLGNKISVLKTVLPPYIYFKPDKKKLYTLLFVDPDLNGLYMTYDVDLVLLGSVYNSPGSSLQLGNQFPYIPPAPRPGTGPHRYIHLVYEQTERINISSKFIMRLACPDMPVQVGLSDNRCMPGIKAIEGNSFLYRYTRTRNDFKLQEFLENNCLGDLVAGNFFIVDVKLCDPYYEQQTQNTSGCKINAM